MKRLFFIIIVTCFFIGCKKEINNDQVKDDTALQNNASLDNGIGPAPVPPYDWQAMTSTLPGPYYALYNSNIIMPVNDEVYCRAAGNLYKLSASKQWEPSSDFSYYQGSQYLFSYQSKVYFGMSYSNDAYINNLFSIDVTNGQVSPRASFPGVAIGHPITFVIGDKGYIVSGETLSGTTLNQFWEYNFSTNQWTNKGNSPLGKRADASAFVVNNKAYMGLGYEIGSSGTKLYKNDWVQYDPATNSFVSMASFPAFRRADADGFVINSSVYVGCGLNATDNFNDFWKYSTSSNTWTQQPNYPGTITPYSYSMSGFTVGSYGYIVKGDIKEFWRFSNSPYVFSR